MNTSKPSNARVVGGIAAGTSAVLLLAAGIVAKWEGKRFEPYPDPATGGEPWTVCYGHTGPDVVRGRKYTEADCDRFLQHDLGKAQATVRRCIPVPMQPHQEAALISATFNIGPRVVCNSTLQRLALAGDWAGACKQLERWKYAAGRPMRGLVLRRVDERAMCEGRLQ